MRSTDIIGRLFQEWNDILVSKVKEALDDGVFICDWTEKAIKSNAQDFSHDDKQQMIRDIDIAIDRGLAGMECDVKAWLGLVEFFKENGE